MECAPPLKMMKNLPISRFGSQKLPVGRRCADAEYHCYASNITVQVYVNNASDEVTVARNTGT